MADSGMLAMVSATLYTPSSASETILPNTRRSASFTAKVSTVLRKIHLPKWPMALSAALSQPGLPLYPGRMKWPSATSTLAPTSPPATNAQTVGD